ncbi:flagellar hook-length control protein FliK [Amaricoccus sp. W119]|uniref:flagellar hook-length control protein FliK n=1 Tax=Amaricoccus sp. W119 TaxID=3391833 RepID=UPI0039A4F912
MNAPDLGFLGPARQARTEAARETRLSGEGTAPPGTSDFAVAMGNPGAPARAAEKPRAAREAAGAPREGTASAADTVADTVGEAMTGPGDPPLTAEAPEDATLTEQGLADGALADAAPTEAMPTPEFPTGLVPRPDASERARASDAAALAAPEGMSTAGMGAVGASTPEVRTAGNGPGQAQPEGAPGATPGAAAARSGAGAVAEAVIEGVPANAASAPEALGATAAIQRSAVPAPGTGTGKSAAGSDTQASPLSARDPSAEGTAPTLAAGPASRGTDPAILDAAADAAGFATRTDPAAVADAASSGQPSITQLTISPLSMGSPDAAARLTQAAPAEAPPGQTRAVVEQIAVAVAESDESRVEIRLDPAELGRVHISLTRTEHGVHAMVTAERPETLELLRRNAETLTRELGAAGYDSVSLDMSQGSRNFGGDGPPERPAEIYAVARGAQGAAGPGAAPISDTTRAGGRAGAADGPLDIRL